jgi:diguanylate cyclase (GGDEF)-like protein/PAS domain S-box-containing protein
MGRRLPAATARRNAAPEADLTTVDRYQLLLAASADVGAVTTTDGVYRYVSPACLDTYGWLPSQLVGRPEEDFVDPADVGVLHAGRLESDAGGTALMCYRFRCRDGSYRWSEATARRAERDGTSLRVTTLRDIASREQLMKKLHQRAFADPLTGTANRALLMDRLEHGLRRLERDEAVLTLIYIDLDEFKSINDSFGHRVGDQVLCRMVEHLAAALRPADTLARMGGDEFAVVAEGLSDEDAAASLAQRLLEAGRAALPVDPGHLLCTISLGLTTTRSAEASADDVLWEADLALYDAKRRGRDRVQIFHQELRARAVEQQASDLRDRLLTHDRAHLAVPARRTAHWYLSRDPRSCAAARSRLRALLHHWGQGPLLDPAELLTSELVKNAVEHADSDVLLGVTHWGDRLRFEVTDAGQGTPRLRETALTDVSGRGLRLVEALSDAWGIAKDGAAKTVWFELRFPRPS